MSNEGIKKAQKDERFMRITIVASEYNRRYTDALLEHCRTELEKLAERAGVNVVRVPGAFEIPVMVNRELAKGNGARPEARRMRI